jgi:hypothetical protein
MEWIYPPHIQDQINGIDEQVEMLLKSKIRLLQNSVPKLLLTEEEVAKIDCDKVLIKLKPKPKTNADRIRNMSDEELAEFLLEVNSTIQHCMIMDCKYEDEREGLCKNCFLEWLQAEVKEGAE